MAEDITRIVSGGQTGVDRAALDFAIAHGVDHGGWCPSGGWAEDHPEPPGLLDAYPRLQETPDPDPAQRTEWNVRDSDATVILRDADPGAVSRGTDRARAMARRWDRSCLEVDITQPASSAAVRAFIRALPAGSVVNVAGPRESEAPGIYAAATRFLEEALT